MGARAFPLFIICGNLWSKRMLNFMSKRSFAKIAALAVFLAGLASASFAAEPPAIRKTLLPPGVHGRLTKRTMMPTYITIHATENPDSTAARHALYLSNKGKRSGKRGRSGWVTWHFTVDDREIVQHLLATEQGDHADFGRKGDRTSIAIEICEFRSAPQQAAAIDRTHTAHKLWRTCCKFNNNICTPRLPSHNGPLQFKLSNEKFKIVGNGGHIETVIGL